jgi:DNA-binding response OmpR family regulator
MIKILVVEDDKVVAYSMKYALEDYNVDFADSLKEARLKLNENFYDLILLDVMLPDGVGYDLCREIRESSDVGIIFLTACDEEVNIVMGLDIGGDDYITKPFRVSELISRIRAVLRRKNNFKDIIKFGNIKISTKDFKVFKEDREIFLTNIEYKLLIIFIQNKNIVLTRTQILEKLWDVSYDFVNDNTLSVYIKRLREKIEDDKKEPKFIITVRGVGYKFVGDDENAL